MALIQPEQPHYFSRRTLLRSAVLGGAGLLAAYVLGCDDGDSVVSPTATAPSTPTSPPTSPPPDPTGTPSALRWQQISPSGPLPPPRRDHSLVRGELTSGPQLYVFGGRNNEGDLADLWSYDLGRFATDQWVEEATEDGPLSRHGHNAAWDVAGGRMVVFGGQQGSSFFNDVWQFQISPNRWRQLAPTGTSPTPRYGAGAAFAVDPGDPPGVIVSPRRLLVTHGFTSSGRFDDTWSYDLAADDWADVSPAGTRPVERCLMRAVWDAGRERLLMFGGQTTGTPFLDDLWTLESNGWRQITSKPRPSPRTFYAMVFDAGRGHIILFGGRTADGPTNDLWFFDSVGESWSRPDVEGEPPSPRFGHDAVLVGSSLIVFGGRNESGDLNDLWELTLTA